MKMGLELIIRFGYLLMSGTIILMIWASLARAAHREIENMKYPPCTFNPLCTCSKAAPDLGIVYCKDVPFPAIPKMVNNSKVFMLQMENTGLREIEPYFLQATGMYRLKISNNFLTEIPDDAFTGLERSLWELILPHNDLIEIPSKSFRHLQKLRHLDLSYNHITTILHDSFRGLEDSLQTLALKENSISTLPHHGFSGLLLLETLDLSGNNLYEIDERVFKDGMPRLSKLLLTDNMLSEIPYTELSPLKQLRTLDISHNIITSMTANDTGYGSGKSGVKLNLDNLHLEYNHIDMLPPNSFQNLDIVNRTFFDGNPIKTIMEDAFKPAKIREIYMRYCGLTNVSPVAFDSLVNTLQILDLSGNNISTLPEKVFNNFDFLRVLSLRDNQIKIISPIEMFNTMQYSLLKLDISGDKNAATNLQELRKMRNMRSLSISKMNTQSLTPEEFVDFGTELEDLQITRGGLQSIKSHAFKYVRGIKRLDLSENNIGTIENDAFTEIGHSLISLKISHGYSGSSLPSDALRHLTSLQELDFSNNKISTISDTSFHFLKNLRLLELHDNRIEQVMKGTFQGDIHSKLEEISFKFNNLKQISQHTFFDLEALQKLHLDDNKIDKIEKRAFMNLDQLEHLSLRGNKLTSISDESFQLYATDPLPKNICKKCVTNVTMIFDECQKLLKVQKKWIDNVRTNQPDHPYVYILNMIERSNKDVISNIKTIAPDFQFRAFRPLFEMHNSMTSDYFEMDNERLTKDDINRIFSHNQNSLNSSYNEPETVITKHIYTDSKKSSPPIGGGYCLNDFSLEEMPASPKMSDSLEDTIREIKNKLQSNGCTLMSITSPSEYDYRTPSYSFREANCSMCERSFHNEKYLAKHMLTHATVSVQRIFDKKCLNRKIRRGRLITMGDNKCIRCLNCWKIFPDNRGILDHWSNCVCEFYCQICGKEFPNSPKMLREHVPAQHGISYKSSRRRTHASTEVTKAATVKHKNVAIVKKKTAPPLTPPLTSPLPPVPTLLTPKMKKEPAPAKVSLIKPMPAPKRRRAKKSHPSKCVTCELCLSTFANYQAKNSHMRIHKNEIPILTPPVTYRNNISLNNIQDREEIPLLEVKKEPEDQYEPVTQIETEVQEPVVKEEKPDNGYEDYMQPLQPLFPQQNRIQPASGPISQPILTQRKTKRTPESYAEKLKVPGEILDYGGRQYNCHPCGKKFMSKTELYDHKKRCQLNNKYACRFCLRAFITSADLQVHIMLMHRSS